MVDRIVINSVRCAEGLSTVGAACEHHVGSSGEAGRLYARNHVNVVVCGCAGTIHRQETLPCKSSWIYRVAENQTAAKVDLGDLVKRWRDARILCVALSEYSKTGC